MPETSNRVLGRRIQVIGNSGSGKSTLAARLSEILEIPLVELDALNWKPGWIDRTKHDPGEFERLVGEATSGDAWVVAGSYGAYSRRIFWSRLETLIWLDLPMPQLLWRVLRRSWRRWRTNELLWGTNHERFWPHLAVWRGEESLVWWIVTQHARKRRSMLALQTDPAWSHIDFIRLRSAGEVQAFVDTMAKSADRGQ